MLQHVTLAEVIQAFSEDKRSIPIEYADVEVYSRHGRFFTKRDGIIRDQDGRVWKLEELVTFVNDTVDWINKRRVTPMVASDCLGENLKHPLTGKYTDSKSKFRQMTRENGGIEIGNSDEMAVADRQHQANEVAQRESVRETLRKHKKA